MKIGGSRGRMRMALKSTGLWLAGNQGLDKKMETTIMGYIGISIRIHSFIPR